MDKFRVLLVAGTCAAIFALAFSWGVPTRCVQLPNGMNIGKQAIIDFAECSENPAAPGHEFRKE